MARVKEALGLALIVLFGIPSALSADEIPTVVRAAFDIGSGVTKLVVARVDPAQNRVVQVLYPRKDDEGSRKVPYQQLLQNPTPEAMSAAASVGKKALLELAKEASLYRPVEMVGVATAAFRKAGPAGERLLQRLQEETGIRMSVLTPEEEGILGFEAVQQTLGHDPASLAVWDIGSASMELTVQTPKDALVSEGGYLVDHLPLGSVPFAAYLTDRLERKNGSPNPLTDRGLQIGGAHLTRVTRQVNPRIRGLLRDQKIKIVGIGGVHHHSIRGQANMSGSLFFTRAMVREALEQKKTLSDSEIGGPFASTQVSNLLLVHGLMERLDIDRVYPLKINLADAILTHRSFWTPGR